MLLRSAGRPPAAEKPLAAPETLTRSHVLDRLGIKKCGETVMALKLWDDGVGGSEDMKTDAAMERAVGLNIVKEEDDGIIFNTSEMLIA